MMRPAQRHGELVADFASKGALLRELKMVCIRRAATAGQAGLSAHELQMIPIPQPQRLADRGDGFPGNSIGFDALRRSVFARSYFPAQN